MKDFKFSNQPIWLKVILLLLAGLLLFLIVVPMPKFNDPTCTVVFSKEGELLGARIADDGQWRFPATKKLPGNYKKALIGFEDSWFYFHPGVNPVSLVRALYLNIRNKKVVSGGSTISMQVARLSRKNPARTIPGKLLEMCMAIKLEILKSKKHILGMYASAAPFGGNVVGIEAASWRYFNRPAEQLSWAEASVLAILPNAPSLMFPGKNAEKLRVKRNNLLLKLRDNNTIDQLTYELSIAEELPVKPLPLPEIANHVVEKFSKTDKGKNITSTIDYSLQQKVNNIVELHRSNLSENQIYNISALVTEVETGQIVAYVGNVQNINNKHNEQVDVAEAPRSSGSILKPFLYAGMLHSGEILPNTLVPDIPVNFNGFSPKNFDYTYSGAVPASQALSKSLNIPAVEMLQDFGEARFLNLLRNLKFSTFTFPAEHYGLSLILGGGETKLIELAGAYSSMARILNHYNQHKGYNSQDISLPQLTEKPAKDKKWNQQPILSSSAIWLTFNALKEVNRPSEREGWRNFSSSGEVAWKTGTSFGLRDAWAVGTTPNYVVAVWAGNATGEGRPSLTGNQAAAPILFDILDLLPINKWFDKPENELITVDVCAESGYKASSTCPHVIKCEIPESGTKTAACPYHQLIHLTSDRQWQVNANCYNMSDMVHDSCFVLTPGMEWYYRKLHPEYFVLPPFMNGCTPSETFKMMELLYPKNLKSLFVPNELNGRKGKIVFEIAHRNIDTRLFWHVDGEYLGETTYFHQMGLSPDAGPHKLTVVDEEGNQLTKFFTVVSKKMN